MNMSKEEEEDMRELKWKGDLLLNKSNVYMDLSRRNLFNSYYKVEHIREDIIERIPLCVYPDRSEADVDKLFMPFSFNVDPLWYLGIAEGAINSTFAPVSLLYSVIRDWPTSLFDMVTGQSIMNVKQFNELLYEFNELFRKIVSKASNGTSLASVDEVIRLSSMLYVLLRTCDTTQPPYTHNDSYLSLEWNERQTFITSEENIMRHSKKLEQFAFSGMDWANFCFRYLPETDERTLWLFNLPPIFSDDEHGDSFTDFSPTDVYKVLNVFVDRITQRNGKAMIIMPHDDQVIEEIIKNFHLFASYDSNVYYGDEYVLHRNVAKFNAGRRERLNMSIITNYRPEMVRRYFGVVA